MSKNYIVTVRIEWKVQAEDEQQAKDMTERQLDIDPSFCHFEFISVDEEED